MDYPAWRPLTEDDAALNHAERAAYRSSLLGPGEADRLPGVIAAVTAQVRQAIRSCRSSVLDPRPDTVPESAAYHAGALIRYRLLSHFPGAASDSRRREYEDAMRYLEAVAACRILVEAPGNEEGASAPPKALPRFTRPTLTQRREDANGA